MKSILLLLLLLPLAAAQPKPDILFIAVDDLNDWISPLGGHPQTLTPNFERLASQSMLFDNAHCIAPSCGPVRAAIMSGIPPWKSGLYHNMQPLREILPEVTLMPRHFANHGYHAAGAGKILHYIIDAPSWDSYFPDKAKENPLPFTLYPEKRPVALPRAGRWQYIETDWGPLDATDQEFGGDYAVTKWVAEQLANPPDKPQFLACGIYRPHEPWFVPAKYFEPFPLETIQMPPGYRANDLDDVPPAGRQLARNRYFPHIQWHGEWRRAVQSYLASIHFADAMLGRVLDALEKSPRRDNTIVVLWSDHGWHLGEKEHWQKYTGWRACTRVPLMIHAPKGSPGLPMGSDTGTCHKPVSTFDLFRTLVSLVDIPESENLHGNNLTPLLGNPEAAWPHRAITQLGKPGDYAVSGERFRYIHYRDGSEELYDISKDPHEFNNLASDPRHAEIIQALRKHGPKDPAPLKALDRARPKLDQAKLVELNPSPQTPPSQTSSKRAAFLLRNVSNQAIQLFWIDSQGERRAYGKIAKASERVMTTFVGHTWLIENLDGTTRGHFIVPENGAQILIE